MIGNLIKMVEVILIKIRLMVDEIVNLIEIVMIIVLFFR